MSATKNAKYSWCVEAHPEKPHNCVAHTPNYRCVTFFPFAVHRCYGHGPVDEARGNLMLSQSEKHLAGLRNTLDFTPRVLTPKTAAITVIHGNRRVESTSYSEVVAAPPAVKTEVLTPRPSNNSVAKPQKCVSARRAEKYEQYRARLAARSVVVPLPAVAAVPAGRPKSPIPEKENAAPIEEPLSEEELIGDATTIEGLLGLDDVGIEELFE